MFTFRTKIIIFSFVHVVLSYYILYIVPEIVTTIINLVINTLKIEFEICMEIKRFFELRLIFIRDGNWR